MRNLRTNIAAVAKGLVVLLCLCTANFPAWGQSRERDHFLFKIGSVYDQGDFGSSEISRVLFTPITLRYLGERFDVSVTPSFALVNTSGGIRLIEGQPTPTGETTGGLRETQSGAGDTLLRGRIYLVDDQGPRSPVPSVTPFVKVKLPTAKEELRLGTGETDYGFGLEIDKQFPPIIFFGDVSYTVIGKIEGLALRNRTAASFGVGGRLSNAVLLSGLIDWRRSIITGNDDLAELVTVLTFRMSPNAYLGLTRGTSDFGLGFELAFRFGRY
jgi:hypothetical protein